ncbi:hypothetical protein [Candidatus Berkiella aquae]|uniref:Uncharacterized protein n=1 Tax=Candidatus Berkiella aquae TaxID=295108 RepID=A0A0Q9YS85_9GAMM|nr:hypothetical protein [Candidatus Berkiella aquae]MCS5711878.1 hypothetical protein [Candidatus Berkiella aquae]
MNKNEMTKILDNLAEQINENLALHCQYADDSYRLKLMTNNLKEQVTYFLERVYCGYPKANYPACPLWLLENKSLVEQWITHEYMDDHLKEVLSDSLHHQLRFPGQIPSVDELSSKERFIKTGKKIWDGITLLEFLGWIKSFT